MYFIDYHTHTSLSPDGHVPLAEMARAAEKAGLSELCVTDHYDRILEHGGFAPDYDWSPALEQFRTTAPAFEGKLQLRFGIEYGSAPFDPDYARRMLALPELDFVIGSLHNLSPELGGEDFFYFSYDSEETCRRVLDDYFASMLRLVELPETYDILGHIIYPLRYMPQEISLDPWWDSIDTVLRRVVETGRGIELNTYCGKTVAPWRPILERYRALGGELITVGSDAHFPERVGLGIPAAYDLLKDTGFRYVTTYHRHNPVPKPL